MSKRMKPAERRDWILRYLLDNLGDVDVLNSDFIDDFAEATGSRLVYSHWGANWCRNASSDLAYLAKVDAVRRHRTGLSCGAWQPGFPKWVWSYGLHKPSKLGRARDDLERLFERKAAGLIHSVVGQYDWLFKESARIHRKLRSRK